MNWRASQDVRLIDEIYLRRHRSAVQFHPGALELGHLRREEEAAEGEAAATDAGEVYLAHVEGEHLRQLRLHEVCNGLAVWDTVSAVEA